MLCLPISAFAADLDFLVPKTTVTMYTGRTNTLEILINNEGTRTDTIYFSIWPSEWIDMDRYFVSVEPGSTKTITLKITPPIDANVGTLSFTLTGQVVSTKEYIAKDIYVDMRRKTNVFVTDIVFNKQVFTIGDTLIIQPEVSNVNEKESYTVTLKTNVIKDGRIIESFEEEFLVKSEKTKKIIHNMKITNTMLPGEYEISTSIRDDLNKVMHDRSSDFEVDRVDKIGRSKEVGYGLFSFTTLIHVSNDGNVANRQITITETMPSISRSFFFPDDQPTYEAEKDNRMIYTWTVTLNPGESVTIRYQLRFVSAIILSSISIVIIVFILWMVFKPTLTKRYIGMLSEKGPLTVTLHVKNRSRKTIKNALITDFVPSIARVLRQFESLTPEVRRTDKGTSLTWHLKEVKSGDEIILSYKIKPIIQLMGQLKLAKAYFRYDTTKGVKKKVCSKTIVIGGKKVK